MIQSKPRHGEPLGEIRDGKLYASRQFQRYLDDLERQVNLQGEKISQLSDQIADLDQRVTALEP